jgi:hypothetical protein
MYCIKKFADCWAIYDLEKEVSRPLTEEEQGIARREIPALADPGTAAWYSDRVDCITDKP